MLVLVGIAGATALSSKAAAMHRVAAIPEEYQPPKDKRRLPRISDMFSIGGQPNLFKFQMFAFTLLIGGLVVLEVLETGNFPVLDDNLLVLMGISSGTYVANELGTPGKWKDVQTHLKEIAEKKGGVSKARVAAVELKGEESGLEKALRQATHTQKADVSRKLVDVRAKIGKVEAKEEALVKERKDAEKKLRDMLEEMYTGEATTNEPDPASEPAPESGSPTP